MLVRTIFVLAIILASSGSVYAECSYNGKTYPEGTILGPYICSDGKWVRT